MTFINSETIRKAYLGKHAQRLLFLSSEQVADVYKDRGICIPVSLSSTLQVIAQGKGMSLADIARALDIPHQLVSQRTEKLLKLDLIIKQADPNDGRRSEYHLTKLGDAQAKLLKQCMEDTALIYGDLYDEIECDLAQALLDAIHALERTSLRHRFLTKFNSARETS